MALKDLLKGRRFRPDDAVAPTPPFDVTHADDGATFTTSAEVLEAARRGDAEQTVQEQFLVLDSLAERGVALELPDGFQLSAETIARLDDDEAAILGLPPSFPGDFELVVTSNTTSHDFAVAPLARLAGRTSRARRSGGVVAVGASSYRLTPASLRVLSAVDAHRALDPASRAEVRNVRLVAELQAARRQAARLETPDATVATVSLGHLDRFFTRVPERVGLTVEPRPDGSLDVTPNLGADVTPDLLDRRWGQLDVADDAGVLRVEDQLVLLEAGPLAGVRDVLANPRIPADQVDDFYRSPASFYDAEHVDVDLHFGVRVRGVGVLAPVSFAQAERSELSWFEHAGPVLPPSTLTDRATSVEEHEEIDAAIDRAWSDGYATVPIGDDLVDISDHERVTDAMRAGRERLARQEPSPDDRVADALAQGPATGPQVRVGIVLHDSGDDVARARSTAADARPEAPVDYSGLRRSPYPHQREGIEWMTGLMQASLDGDDADPGRVRGALLADDMGLGKTFMTLVALRELQRTQQRRGRDPLPVLAVMPVSLLENWHDEVAKTFEDSPFDDVVVLHGPGVTRYSKPGARRETTANASDVGDDGLVRGDAIRFALRVGATYGPGRLDTPNRLVLTNYETLRGFQLSLAQVDWGAVVLDEAQAIKNPDIALTRAAKALKARFVLAATGTPVENRLQEFWSVLDAAQPGLLGTWPQFREAWDDPIANATGSRKAELGRDLREHVGPFMLRRLKEDHLPDLPSKTVHNPFDDAAEQALARQMPEAQLTAYDDALARFRATGRGQQGAALKTLQALRAISLHPVARDAPLGDEGRPRWEDSARLLGLVEILDRIRDADEKVIVFVSDKAVQRQLQLWVRDRYGFLPHVVNGDTAATGTTSTPTRKRLIEAFEARPGFNVIVLSPLAAGTGLTVVGANHAVHLERHWNPAKEAQATDRIYRIGQKRPVHVYHPMALHPDVDSFDVNLDRLLRGKVALKDAVLVPDQVGEAELLTAMGLAAG
jgi:hypothetical protein